MYIINITYVQGKIKKIINIEKKKFCPFLFSHRLTLKWLLYRKLKMWAIYYESSTLPLICL